jgi:hypothetical protein
LVCVAVLITAFISIGTLVWFSGLSAFLVGIGIGIAASIVIACLFSSSVVLLPILRFFSGIVWSSTTALACGFLPSGSLLAVAIVRAISTVILIAAILVARVRLLFRLLITMTK